MSFRQLCAIALDQLQREPTIDCVEWKERIKDRTVAIGYLTPLTEVVYRAMNAIEHAHPTLRQAVATAPPTPVRMEQLDPTRLQSPRVRCSPTYNGMWTSVSSIFANDSPSSNHGSASVATREDR